MEGECLTESMILTRSQNMRLESIRRVNLWGLNIRDVSLLNSMPMLEVISLSSNKIDSLEAFTHCTHLKELYLRNNNIQELEEIKHLSKLSFLHTLFLLGNPCCYAPDTKEIDSSTEPSQYYRPTVIRHLSSLVRLDLQHITSEESRAARSDAGLPSPNDTADSSFSFDSVFNEPYTKNENSDCSSSTITSKPEKFSKEMKFQGFLCLQNDEGDIIPQGNGSNHINSIDEDVVNSARKRIPLLSFSTKQTLVEILHLLPKLNRDSLVLLSNEIATRLRYLCGSEPSNLF